MASEARPSAIENAIEASSTARPTSDCATRKAAAARDARRAPRAAGGPGCARRRRRACGRECRCRCSRRRAWRSRRQEQQRDARGSGPRCAASPASAADSQHGASSNCQPAGRSSAQAARTAAPNPAPAAARGFAGARREAAPGRETLEAQSGPVGSGWACGAAALRLLLLHLLDLRGDRAGLGGKSRALAVVGLELGDRLVGDLAPVLVLLHVGDHRVFARDEAAPTWRRRPRGRAACRARA